MILIKRLDLSLKTPKEKLVALFSQTAELNETTDSVIYENLSHFPVDWAEDTLNAVKRLLGLPITKPLVYCKRSNGGWKPYPVQRWEIVEEYSAWCTLKICVEELGEIKIHHAFLSEMQKTSFEQDMQKQMDSE